MTEKWQPFQVRTSGIFTVASVPIVKRYSCCMTVYRVCSMNYSTPIIIIIIREWTPVCINASNMQPNMCK